LPSIGSVLGLQRTLSAALDDLNSIAAGMRLLPELAKSLASIDERVSSLDDEVREMHAAVERLNLQVGDLQGTLHPLRRSASRIGRLTRRAESEPQAGDPET
jgi:chromosome segregation ATPase